MTFGDDVLKVLKPSFNKALDICFPAARETYFKFKNQRDLKALEELCYTTNNPLYRLLMTYNRLGRFIEIVHKWENFYEECGNWPHASIKLLDELKLDKDKSGIELLVEGIENLDNITSDESVVYFLPHECAEIEGPSALGAVGSYINKRLGKDTMVALNDFFAPIKNLYKAAFFLMNAGHSVGDKEKYSRNIKEIRKRNIKEIRKTCRFLEEEKGHLIAWLTEGTPCYDFRKFNMVLPPIRENFIKATKISDWIVPLYLNGPRPGVVNNFRYIRDVFGRTRYLFSFGGKQFMLHVGKPIRYEDLKGETLEEKGKYIRSLCYSLGSEKRTYGSIKNVKKLL